MNNIEHGNKMSNRHNIGEKQWFAIHRNSPYLRSQEDGTIELKLCRHFRSPFYDDAKKGEYLQFNVYLSDDVRKIKLLVSNHEYIPMKELSIKFAGRELSENQTVEELLRDTMAKTNLLGLDLYWTWGFGMFI